MKPPNHSETLGLITYLRYAVDPDLNSFSAPAFLHHLYKAVRWTTGAMSALFIATLVVTRDIIGPTLLIFGAILAPLVSMVAILATRMIIEMAIAVFIMNDNLMMLRLGAEAGPVARPTDWPNER